MNEQNNSIESYAKQKGYENIKELEQHIRKNFNCAMTVIGLSSTWVFVYLLVAKGGVLKILKGESGLIMLITMCLLLLGITTSRKMLWSVIESLLFYDKKNFELQNEVMEKNRLATISKTVLTLSHELNNPLMIVRGNIHVLEEELGAEKQTLGFDELRERLVKIKKHCDRISQISDKMLSLSGPKETTVHGDIKMFDLESKDK